MLDKIWANWAIIGQQMGKWSRLCSVPIHWGRIGSGGVSGPWPPSGVKRVIPLKEGKRKANVAMTLLLKPIKDPARLEWHEVHPERRLNAAECAKTGITIGWKLIF